MNQYWIFPFCPEPPDFNLDWPALLSRFEWLRAMEGCLQEPLWHEEGDVLTHTRMVIEALISDDDWQQLDPATRSVMFAAALLHDMAKPSCTMKEDGRIASPGHARKGAQMAQKALYHAWPPNDVPVPFRERRQIVALVRHHALPLWFLDKPDIERVVITSSLSIRNDLVALLARADVLGRICNDQKGLVDRITLFHEFCQEHDCLSQAYVFPSNHSRYQYFRTPARSPLYEAYDDTQMEVVMMSGLPGSGKDVWIGRHPAGYPVVSLDTLREQMGISPEDHQGAVVDRAKDMARGYLRQGQSFIWNATNVTFQMRQGLIDLFAAYNVRVRIVYLEAPWSELLRRNQLRTSPVPVGVIGRLADRLDVPEMAEAHQVDWVVPDK